MFCVSFIYSTNVLAVLIFTPYIKLQNCIDQDKEVTKSDIVSAYPSSIKKTGQSAGPGGNRRLQPGLCSAQLSGHNLVSLN